MRWNNVIILLFGVAWATACAVAAGWSLGAFIGPLAGVAVVVPLLTAGESRRAMLSIVIFFCGGVNAVWIGGVMKNAITLPQWMSVGVLLMIVALAFAMVGHALTRARLPTELGGATGVFLALAWLAAPFWLPINVSPSTVINAMVATHPVFAINAILPQFGEWTELPATYHLTTLGQDVAYHTPASAWMAVVLHAIVGCLVLIFSSSRHEEYDAVSRE